MLPHITVQLATAPSIRCDICGESRHFSSDVELFGCTVIGGGMLPGRAEVLVLDQVEQFELMHLHGAPRALVVQPTTRHTAVEVLALNDTRTT
jgi:hypothetical protein